MTRKYATFKFCLSTLCTSITMQYYNFKPLVNQGFWEATLIISQEPRAVELGDMDYL